MDQDTPPSTEDAATYTVVARRYRPKNFDELIGQDHIAAALSKAIASGRVGHAYLFTGARGVGKTSTARIFAKALNLAQADEQTAQEIGAAIDAGEDMDVIEIDGASNRGIEEIRQLRANVNVRPSRSTYKIYIIDEVHMLTNQAFNALLKTLEEPPAHVKFIFCTTDPDKIPITVLSRCQRFDFAPVKLEAIQGRLSEICVKEGVEADEEALALLARRAAGSMRDSQSLLEQVMSFSTDKISVEQVHTLLGTADESRLQAFVEALIDKDALKCVTLVDESIRGGSDAGQIAEQLLGYLRDLMAVAVGGSADLLKLANPSSHDDLKQLAENFGMQTILSAAQILDESLVRMRTSVSAVTLLEIALVQICQLEQIASIPALLEAVQSGVAASPSQKKTLDSAAPAAARPVADAPADFAAKPSPAPPNLAPQVGTSALKQPEPDKTHVATVRQDIENTVAVAATNDLAKPQTQGDSSPKKDSGTSPTHSSAPTASSNANASTKISPSPTNGQDLRGSSDCLNQWQASLKTIDGLLADYAGMAVRIEPQGSMAWKVVFPDGGVQAKEYCEQTEKRTELVAALASTIGRQITLAFEAKPGEVAKPKVSVSTSSLRAQKLRELSNDPYVKKLCEAIDGEVLRVDLAPEPKPGAPKLPASSNSAAAQ